VRKPFHRKQTKSLPYIFHRNPHRTFQAFHQQLSASINSSLSWWWRSSIAGPLPRRVDRFQSGSDVLKRLPQMVPSSVFVRPTIPFPYLLYYNSHRTFWLFHQQLLASINSLLSRWWRISIAGPLSRRVDRFQSGSDVLRRLPKMVPSSGIVAIRICQDIS
jgi:hypothetical protein